MQILWPAHLATAIEQRYPDLLGGMSIKRCNHVWSCDITYIRLMRGFLSLVAVIDWFSRYVLSWEIAITLAPSCCLAALGRAVPFTSAEVTNRLKVAAGRISWDGQGRA